MPDHIAKIREFVQVRRGFVDTRCTCPRSPNDCVILSATCPYHEVLKSLDALDADARAMQALEAWLRDTDDNERSVYEIVCCDEDETIRITLDCAWGAQICGQGPTLAAAVMDALRKAGS